MYTYVYICIYIYVCIQIYIYVYTFIYIYSTHSCLQASLSHLSLSPDSLSFSSLSLLPPPPLPSRLVDASFKYAIFISFPLSESLLPRVCHQLSLSLYVSERLTIRLSLCPFLTLSVSLSPPLPVSLPRLLGSCPPLSIPPTPFPPLCVSICFAQSFYTRERIVTNSSAEVGWTPMVESK